MWRVFFRKTNCSYAISVLLSILTSGFSQLSEILNPQSSGKPGFQTGNSFLPPQRGARSRSPCSFLSSVNKLIQRPCYSVLVPVDGRSLHNKVSGLTQPALQLRNSFE